jgi:hypothetical protein
MALRARPLDADGVPIDLKAHYHPKMSFVASSGSVPRLLDAYPGGHELVQANPCMWFRADGLDPAEISARQREHTFGVR